NTYPDLPKDFTYLQVSGGLVHSLALGSDGNAYAWGWFTGQVAYDFSRPVDKDLTLTAHWTPASRNSGWSISPDNGGIDTPPGRSYSCEA
ncbi:RCC1 domain-containing protein, partial [Bifidobacterium sp. H1HS16N]